MDLIPILVDALKRAPGFVLEELEIREQSYLPEPSEYEAADLEEARSVLNAIDGALYVVSGTANEQQPSPQANAGGNG